MGKSYTTLNERHRVFIAAQKMFFVGTAPLSGDGHVNVSPKGFDSFRVLDDQTVAYVDRMGSGIETVSHVKENGRLVVMFCSFEGPPLILRLYGHGRIVEPGDPSFDELVGRFPAFAATRSIVVLDVTRVSDSCGWGVPLYAYEGMRDQYDRFTEKQTPEDVRNDALRSNMTSIDGLRGLSAPRT